jgi:hypothetical protein
MTMKKPFRSARIFVVLLAAFASNVGAVEITSDVDSMLSTLISGSHDEQMQICRDLEIAGLSDRRLFDQVEKNLLASYQSNTRNDAEYAAWLTKCLAFSGVESYRKTIEEVAQNGGHRGIKRHGVESQETLSEHGRWNPQIVGQPDDAGQSLAANRIIKAFRVNDIALQMAAAKWAFERNISDESALDVIESTVKPLIKRIQTKENVQATAYMLKALARTGNPRYRATIEEVTQSGSEPKLRKYAASYLNTYY